MQRIAALWLYFGVLPETGQFAVSASEDGTARVWNMASKKTIGTLNSGGEAEVLRVALLDSQRATTVVTCTADGVARIWTRPQPNQAYGITGRFDHSGGQIYACECLGSTPSSLLTAADNVIYLWDLEQENRQHWAFDREGTCHFGGQRNPDDEVVVFDAKPAPNQSDIIAIALSDGTLRTLDLREDAARIIGQASDVHLTSITWRDPTTVITCSGTGEVASWDIRTSARLSTIQAHDRAVFGAALLDSTLLTYSSDSLLKLWDIDPADGTTHHTCTQVLWWCASAWWMWAARP